MIGLHVEKSQHPAQFRAFAKQNGWGAIQNQFGSPQSYWIPADVQGCQPGELLPIFQAWHAAYSASVAPNEIAWEGCGNYLREVSKYAKKFSIDAIVIHTGATSGIPLDTVLARMDRFIKSELLTTLVANQTRIAVEIGASTTGFNLEPSKFVEAWKGSHVGWCLDLAHGYGAGCTWNEIYKAIEIEPPLVCHANFPGTVFGTSRDVHGWRSNPMLMKYGRAFAQRRPQDIEVLAKDWDAMVRHLHGLGVPLIVEGSGFPGSTLLTELALIREIIGA